MSEAVCTLLGYALLLLAIRREARRDAARIALGRHIDHARGALRRSAWMAPAAVLLMAGRIGWSGGWFLTVPELKMLALCCLLCMALWWLLFDLLLNRLRGLPWGYTGGGDNQGDAVADNVLEAMPAWARLPVKLLLVALFAWLVYR